MGKIHKFVIMSTCSKCGNVDPTNLNIEIPDNLEPKTISGNCKLNLPKIEEKAKEATHKRVGYVG
jgi:hypothetical protein